MRLDSWERASSSSLCSRSVWPVPREGDRSTARRAATSAFRASHSLCSWRCLLNHSPPGTVRRHSCLTLKVIAVPETVHCTGDHRLYRSLRTGDLPLCHLSLQLLKKKEKEKTKRGVVRGTRGGRRKGFTRRRASSGVLDLLTLELVLPVVR